MKTMQEKFENDPKYASCVQMMEAMIHNNEFTPSEMREMAVYACIRYEMLHGRPKVYRLTKQTEAALRVLGRTAIEGS